MLWIQFIICAGFIIVSGYKLAVCADIICEKTKLSRGFMGILILAFITSCPELVTGLSSIALVNAPDLAMGDLLGANIFNILAIVILGIMCGKGSILRGQSRVNVITAVLTLLMLLVATSSITLNHLTGLSLKVRNVGFGSILLGFIYLSGMMLIYKKNGGAIRPEAREKIPGALMTRFIISAIIIVASGVWLANIGKNISVFYHLNEMYVGILLIAFATTLPEFIVSLTALKQNSVSMATGNLLGSNLFNLFIIFLLDVSFRKGSLFSYVSNLNLFPACFAFVLTAIALGAMLKKPTGKKILRYFSWDSLIIIGVFVTGHYLLFNLVNAAK